MYVNRVIEFLPTVLKKNREIRQIDNYFQNFKGQSLIIMTIY